MTMMWKDLALVAVGGAVGSVARYLAGRIFAPASPSSVPTHTLVVNVTGAFLLGLLVVMAARGAWPDWWRPLIAVGLLGGYTTFSTFSLEVTEAALSGRWGMALGYGAGSLIAGAAGAFVGIMVGRALP